MSRSAENQTNLPPRSPTSNGYTIAQVLEALVEKATKLMQAEQNVVDVSPKDKETVSTKLQTSCIDHLRCIRLELSFDQSPCLCHAFAHIRMLILKTKLRIRIRITCDRI